MRTAVNAYPRTADQFESTMLPRPVHYFGTGGALTELAPHTLREHRQHFGARPACVGAAAGKLIDRIEQARLTGRGGAHLPSVVKWRAVRAAAGTRGSIVVANGAEGEPDSRKDVALLELRPHLILDGLVCAAEALGAREAIVWLHENAHVSRAALSRALTERTSLGEPAEPAIRIAFGPDAYLSGESGAVVRALSGGPALPAFRTVPSAVKGVDGSPTLVHNVETLARVAQVARGAACASELVTVCIDETRIVLDVPTDASLHTVVSHAIGAHPSAVLVGGWGGSWRAWPDLAKITIAEPSLRAHGLSLGAGVLHALPRGVCGLARAAEIARYLAAQSAQQCGPCQFGLTAVADRMTELARGGRRTRRDAARITAWADEIRGRGACHHPDGAVRMVVSALEVFADDVAAHGRGRCLARRGRS
ncbi:MAG TPA: NADH-ubiquinone oxidoreductase-F iron-sulfur binding region domain-containing protein [Jatrophihabitans sp.]|jgi:NADH:ubiquinone oxidoreductase subunit F (NADH-binding)|nr:NADH-ubiquinone oxidoreductase-F iron-sulfur binding region domain-containing protein [Jatrophihabitans sp.]